MSTFCARLRIWCALTSPPLHKNITWEYEITCEYEASDRYYLGRVLTVLREAFEGRVTLHELGRSMRRVSIKRTSPGTLTL